MNIWQRAVSIVNARVVTPDGVAESVRFGRRILDLNEKPRPNDSVIDADGAFVLPGLINAHDHLELNHYGRLKFRERYTNVGGWIDDMRPRLTGDARISTARAQPLADRLFIGALKNLLAGVTTVAHHNPFYRELRPYPIRVVRRYGWAHSFALQQAPAGANGETGGDIAARHRATPKDAPFFVHLGEGVDLEARDELPRLERLGCLASNVVLIHGVAIDAAEWPRLTRWGAGLVWCPGSNLFLFGRTAAIGQFLAHADGGESRIAIGTDSRLSGGSDLLDELRIAADTGAAPPETLLHMVTAGAARLLRQPGGHIEIGAPADMTVVPAAAADPARALLRTARRDVRLVVVEGRPLVGDASLAAAFSGRRVDATPIAVDGARKLADAALAARIARCTIAEPGLEAA